MFSKNQDHISDNFAKVTFYNGVSHIGLTVEQCQEIDRVLESYGVYSFDRIVLCTVIGDSTVNASISSSKGEIQMSLTRSDRLHSITVTMTPIRPIGETVVIAKFELPQTVDESQEHTFEFSNADTDTEVGTH